MISNALVPNKYYLKRSIFFMSSTSNHSGNFTRIALTGLFLVFQFLSFAQNNTTKYTPVDTKPFDDSQHHWYDISDKQNIVNAVPNQPRYKPSQVIEIADNILLYQEDNGGWPKNYDILAILTEEQKQKLTDAKGELHSTFDNGTTYSHVECLSRIYEETKVEKYKTACIKGLNFILQSQYKNGGWPQYFPLRNDYSRYITYNDDAMIGIMDVLKDIVDQKKMTMNMWIN